ncbi:U4/U6 small nuclear ribonucleoprotein Prp31 [Exaiptasia diaphana]|nr:U4/U6 small nuclear ribonucleoprotein Prp31 [Exaiptasia diaphana]
MSLADELLADLEEAGDEGVDIDYRDNDNDIEEAMETTDTGDLSSKSVRYVAKLRDSDELRSVMNRITEFSNKARDQVFGPVEVDPEYILIVEANNLTAEVDNEINIIHKYLRDLYSKRFPELESLVPHALDYIRTVELLGNDLEVTKVDLTDVLPPATKMVISVTASTTQGEKLDDDEVERITEACGMVTDLLEAKLKILNYVESRMAFIAPNLSIIVGSSTAAKLMGAAGGLTGLSKMPACNLLNMPPDLRRKAARLVSAKCSLAARVDSFHESLDGSSGQALRADIEKKFDKLVEPPPKKEVKALPRPDDAPRKKRGGRRVRKMKEKFAVTEMRRQANRVEFGKIGEDVYQTDLGFSVGTLGRKENTGRVRTPAVDKKTQVSISKRLQRSLQQAQTYGGQSTVKRSVSGTASSVAFTPLQGLEIVNPHAAEKKVADANAKYFSSTAGFLKVTKK